MNKVEVSIEEIFMSFSEHFNIAGNDKIMLSGKYGSGKTYFLQSFFESKIIANQYFTITISPVNYVVSSNEDIFELIKVDIIKQMYIDGDININEASKSIPNIKQIINYCKKHPLNIVQYISKCLTKTNPIFEIVNNTSDAVIKLLEDIEKLQEQEVCPEKEITNYLNNFTSNNNSYIEYNYISQLVTQIINSKKNKTNKKAVLIIEDFDRIDPGHIFRILNILSAHHFENNSGYKFNFDKIILVCDIKNIENIYHHFYGINTDFQGYIDKFFSIEPFYYDNSESIERQIKDLINFKISAIALHTLAEILNIFIKENLISLRNIVNAGIIKINKGNKLKIIEIDDEMRFELFENNINFINSKFVHVNPNEFDALIILKILKTLCGGYENLYKYLKMLCTSNVYHFDNVATVLKSLATSTLYMNRVNLKGSILFEDFSSKKYDYPYIRIGNNSVRIIYSYSNANPYEDKKSLLSNVEYSVLTDYQKKAELSSTTFFTYLRDLYTFFRGQKLL